jgi:hypothetical protein
MKRLWTAAAGFGALAFASAGFAQGDGSLILYSKGHFQGARRAISGPAQYMSPFTIKSVAIPEGTSWELCSGNTFSGCKRFSKSDPATVFRVRSARPVGTSAAGPVAAVGAVAPIPPPGGPSLRGMASEYFVAPEKDGRRIEVRPGTPEEMAKRAGDYCRSIGWRSSVHAALQPSGGTAFLADLLCI